MTARSGLAVAALALLAACAPPRSPGADAPRAGLVDPAATPATRALRSSLDRLRATRVLFGHQDDLAYGYRWREEPGRSDVRETAGSYPAVYGWEVAGIEKGAERNIDGVRFDLMRRWIAEGFARGGVITISWHLDNPLTGGNAWDTTSAVAAILPGGSRHAAFTRALDRFADFARSLRGVGRSGGEQAIPVIFRPFHEMTGGWFWWGAGHATPAEYAALWRFTVTYLRDVKGLHNLLYAYAPNADGASGHEHYLERYPGDAWVDVLGYDSYFDAAREGEQGRALGASLAWLVRESERRAKLPALTETGLGTLPDPSFWTGTLLPAIAGDSVGRRIAYLLVWRNAYRAGRSDDHFYAPFAGQGSAADFRRFRDDTLIAFGDEIPDLYRAVPP